MKIFTKEIKIAITAILAVLIIYIGIIFLKGLKLFSNDNTYYVELKNINGLAVASEVLVNGMNIGNVKSVDYNPVKQNLTVAIDVTPKFQIPEGSKAILSKEMLGSTKLNIILGQDPNKNLVPGDTIEGLESIDLMTQASNMIPEVLAILPKIDSLLANLNRITSDPALAASLHNVEDVTNNLKTTTNRLNSLLEGDVPSLMNKTNNICDNLETTTSNLKDVDFVTLANNANTTLAELQLFTNKLNNDSSTLGLLLNDASVYNQLDSTLNSATLLLQDLRTHPKRYVHFSLFGRKEK